MKNTTNNPSYTTEKLPERPTTSPVCEVCGSEDVQHVPSPDGGELVYLCQECYRAQRRAMRRAWWNIPD